MTSSRNRIVAIVSAGMLLLALAAAYFVSAIPPVEVLGPKVRLPIFHGGSTWVNLMLFALLGVTAVVYLVRGSGRVYAWEMSLRSVAAPLWLVNSVLGLIAAMNTWDFSGSKTSPLVAVRQDPRLMAQFWVLLAIVVLALLVTLVLESRRHKAMADLGFVLVMTALLANVFLDPRKRALHPDSPVLNSGWEIKAPFFGIVLCLMGIALLAVYLIRTSAASEG